MFKRSDIKFESYDNPEQVTIAVHIKDKELFQVTRYKSNYPSHSVQGIVDEFRSEFMKFVETDFAWVILNELQGALGMAEGIENLITGLLDAAEKKDGQAVYSMIYTKVLDYEKNPKRHLEVRDEILKSFDAAEQEELKGVLDIEDL